MDYNGLMNHSMECLSRAHHGGTRLLGYFYPHTPVELVMAHGMIPSLMWPSPSVRGPYEGSLQTFACSFARNLFGQRVNNHMPPVSGLLFPGNTCDSLQNVGDVWRFRFPQDKVLRLTYPASHIGEHSIEFFAEELRVLSRGLEEISGERFSSGRFKQACSNMAEARAALRALYSSRAVDPSVIPYGHLAELLRMFLTLPDAECLKTLKTESSRVTDAMKRKGFLKQVTGLQGSLLARSLNHLLSDRPSGGTRLAAVGGMTEPKAIADLFESVTGKGSSTLVFDMLSLGYKTVFTPDVDDRGDPYVKMARSTLSSPAEPTREGLGQRMSDLKAILKGLYVDGLVICEQSFCDPDEFEAPSIEKASNDAGVASLRLPLDPELSDRARLEGRVQTFMETIAGGH